MLSAEQITSFKQSLGKYVPQEAVDSLFDFLNAHSVQLKVSRKRSTKFGDYRCPSPAHPNHAISVNGDINAYFFLTVLLHEMAHLLTHEQHGTKVKPHGTEWQRNYFALLQQYAHIYPTEVQPSLHAFIQHLPLSTAKQQQFETALLRMDKVDNATTMVNDLQVGDCFRLKGMTFRVVEKRRTRWQCQELRSGKAYLVSGMAPIEKVTPDSQ